MNFILLYCFIMEWLKRGNSITNCIFFLNITLHKIKVILFSSSNFILRNLKEYKSKNVFILFFCVEVKNAKG